MKLKTLILLIITVFSIVIGSALIVQYVLKKKKLEEDRLRYEMYAEYRNSDSYKKAEASVLLEKQEHDELLEKHKEKVIERNKKDEKKRKDDLAKHRRENPVYYERLEKFKKAYGNWAHTIAMRDVVIGMTCEMCIASWGKPNNINTTTNTYGVREQWVYGNSRYLYFDDGVLTTIQD